jgi:nicotinate-nucleotide adenylyltransferase
MIIGIFGGTFDPVHNGHMVAAREVVNQLALDRLYMVVAGTPWQKVDCREVTGAEDRFAMVRAALDDPDWAHLLDRAEVSRLEIDRSGLSYTADTLLVLHDRYPGDDLVLVVGSDVAADLHTWHQVKEVAMLCRLAVVTRRTGEEVAAAADLGFDAVEVPIPFEDISSSEIRKRIASGESITGMVPGSVETYIRKKGLYRE